MNNSCLFNTEIGRLFSCQSAVNGGLQSTLAPNNESSRCFELTLRALSIRYVFILMNRDSDVSGLPMHGLGLAVELVSLRLTRGSSLRDGMLGLRFLLYH